MDRIVAVQPPPDGLGKLRAKQKPGQERHLMAVKKVERGLPFGARYESRILSRRSRGNRVDEYAVGRELEGERAGHEVNGLLGGELR